MRAANARRLLSGRHIAAAAAAAAALIVAVGASRRRRSLPVRRPCSCDPRHGSPTRRLTRTHLNRALGRASRAIRHVRPRTARTTQGMGQARDLRRRRPCVTPCVHPPTSSGSRRAVAQAPIARAAGQGAAMPAPGCSRGRSSAPREGSPEGAFAARRAGPRRALGSSFARCPPPCATASSGCRVATRPAEDAGALPSCCGLYCGQAASAARRRRGSPSRGGSHLKPEPVAQLTGGAYSSSGHRAWRAGGRDRAPERSAQRAAAFASHHSAQAGVADSPFLAPSPARRALRPRESCVNSSLRGRVAAVCGGTSGSTAASSHKVCLTTDGAAHCFDGQDQAGICVSPRWWWRWGAGGVCGAPGRDADGA